MNNEDQITLAEIKAKLNEVQSASESVRAHLILMGEWVGGSYKRLSDRMVDEFSQTQTLVIEHGSRLAQFLGAHETCLKSQHDFRGETNRRLEKIEEKFFHHAGASDEHRTVVDREIADVRERTDRIILQRPIVKEAEPAEAIEVEGRAKIPIDKLRQVAMATGGSSIIVVLFYLAYYLFFHLGQ